MNLLKTLSILLTLTPLAMGCSSPIEGEWQSRQKLSNKKRNVLRAYGDASAELKMYVKLAPTAALTKIKFEGDWAEEGEDFEFDLECDSGCPSGTKVDFKMDCSVIDGVALDCEAKAPFSDYGFFEFEPLEEEG